MVVTPSVATCPAAGVASLAVSANFGDDRIDLSAVTLPAVVDAGDGVDTILGSGADDLFVWNAEDDSDTIDGGPGQDTLAFDGSDLGEVYTVAADGFGFDVLLDVGGVATVTEAVEVLDLSTHGGADTVRTTPLLRTTQTLTAGTDGAADTLRVDAAGLCLVRQGDTFDTTARGTIAFASFADVFVDDAFCRPDPCEGAVATMGCTVNGAPNQPCEGTSGDDSITGTPGPDVIIGGDGRDRLRSGLGDDLVCGGPGDDLIVGAAGNDTLAGGPGRGPRPRRQRQRHAPRRRRCRPPGGRQRSRRHRRRGGRRSAPRRRRRRHAPRRPRSRPHQRRRRRRQLRRRRPAGPVPGLRAALSGSPDLERRRRRIPDGVRRRRVFRCCSCSAGSASP
jgi:Ca2+-binding RTX toxin-like protein